MKSQLKIKLLSWLSIFLSVIYFSELMLFHTQLSLSHPAFARFLCIQRLFKIFDHAPEMIICYLAALLISAIGCLRLKLWGFWTHQTVSSVTLISALWEAFEFYFKAHLIGDNSSIIQLIALMPLSLLSLMSLIVLNNKESRRFFRHQFLLKHSIPLDRNYLEQALFHDDWEIKTRAADALESFGDSHSISPLMKALCPREPTEPNTTRRRREYHWYPETLFILQAITLRPHIYLPFGTVTALPPEVTQNPKAIFRCQVLKTLSHLKDKTILPEISKLLQDTNEMVRICTIDTLKEIDEKEGIPYIIEFLKDPSLFVKRHALYVLNNAIKMKSSPGSRSIEEGREEAYLFYKEWWDKQVSFRQDVSSKLGNLGEKIANEVIKLEDPDENVRAEAIRALDKFKEKAPIPYIIECLKDPSILVTAQALDTLISLTDQKIPLNVPGKYQYKEAYRLYKAWWEKQAR